MLSLQMGNPRGEGALPIRERYRAFITCASAFMSEQTNVPGLLSLPSTRIFRDGADLQLCRPGGRSLAFTMV